MQKTPQSRRLRRNYSVLSQQVGKEPVDIQVKAAEDKGGGNLLSGVDSELVNFILLKTPNRSRF